MADRIVIAGVIILIGLALLGPFNDLFQDSLLPMIANVTGITAFEMATWRFVPLILILFVLGAVLATLIRKGAGSDEGKE
ncbi:unnamed protein product [marine sediment metagenome]|uniref:Uncharacterized protein n=1 Tax=marine sediment metagenome TaxID=412755 RepID=X1AW61_9ZZZZ